MQEEIEKIDSLMPEDGQLPEPRVHTGAPLPGFRLLPPIADLVPTAAPSSVVPLPMTAEAPATPRPLLDAPVKTEKTVVVKQELLIRSPARKRIKMFVDLVDSDDEPLAAAAAAPSVAASSSRPYDFDSSVPDTPNPEFDSQHLGDAF